jgi:hypothetical protein
MTMAQHGTNAPELLQFSHPGQPPIFWYKLPDAVDRVLKISLPDDLRDPLSANRVTLFFNIQIKPLFDLHFNSIIFIIKLSSYLTTINIPSRFSFTVSADEGIL